MDWIGIMMGMHVIGNSKVLQQNRCRTFCTYFANTATKRPFTS